MLIAITLRLSLSLYDLTIEIYELNIALPFNFQWKMCFLQISPKLSPKYYIILYYICIFIHIIYVYVASQVVHKLDHCGHLKPVYKSLRPKVAKTPPVNVVETIFR